MDLHITKELLDQAAALELMLGVIRAPYFAEFALWDRSTLSCDAFSISLGRKTDRSYYTVGELGDTLEGFIQQINDPPAQINPRPSLVGLDFNIEPSVQLLQRHGAGDIRPYDAVVLLQISKDRKAEGTYRFTAYDKMGKSEVTRASFAPLYAEMRAELTRIIGV